MYLKRVGPLSVPDARLTKPSGLEGCMISRAGATSSAVRLLCIEVESEECLPRVREPLT